MLKYAQLIDTNTGLCIVGIGTNEKFYQKLGMEKLDVEQSKIDNQWYLSTKLDNENYRQQVKQHENEMEIKSIKRELEELDLKSIRAIRANETERLKELEENAKELREKLNNI